MSIGIRHFKSKQYKCCGQGGMEVHGKAPRWFSTNLQRQKIYRETLSKIKARIINSIEKGEI